MLVEGVTATPASRSSSWRRGVAATLGDGASPPQLSWEHGLVREREIRNPKSEIRNYLTGRGEADAPDIDGRVYIRVPRGGMPIGEFARVKVIGHTDYDLIAEMAGRNLTPAP